MPNPNFRGPLNEEELGKLRETEAANIQETLKQIGELATKRGYSEVQTYQELGLTSDQEGRIVYNSQTGVLKSPYQKYYLATRKDGVKVRVLASPAGSGKVISADFFSPVFSPNGHGSNHDFNYSEFDGMLRTSLE